MADIFDVKIKNGMIQFDSNGDLLLIRGAERVAQQLQMRLDLWRGEWFLDADFGTPYLQRIMGKTAVTIDAAIDAMRTEILDVDDVNTISSMDYQYDQPSRKLTLTFECSTDFGIVPLVWSST